MTGKLASCSGCSRTSRSCRLILVCSSSNVWGSYFNLTPANTEEGQHSNE